MVDVGALSRDWQLINFVSKCKRQRYASSGALSTFQIGTVYSALVYWVLMELGKQPPFAC